MNLSIFLKYVVGCSLVLQCAVADSATSQDANSSDGAPTSVSAPASATLTRDAIDEAFSKNLREIAAWCQEQKLEKEQTESLRVFLVRDPQRQYIFLPDRAQTNSHETAADLSSDWQAKVHQARKDHAKQLFTLARLNAESGGGAVAFQLLHEVLYWDEDFAPARKALGHKQSEDGWLAYSEKLSVKTANKPHPDLNWSAGSYLLVTTDNFEIASQADEATTIFLAEQLQRWHWVWRQVFFDYWSNAAAVENWISGDGKARPTTKKFRIVFFRDHDQYVAELEKTVKGIGASTGYYSDEMKTSYFYASQEESIFETWRHESTHQLFQESIRTRNAPFAKGYLWLGEGIAMYMESLKDFGPFATLGGFDSRRLQYARVRKLREGFYVPMLDLNQLALTDFQQHPDVRHLYSQSAGLCHFFMNAESGRFRIGLVQLIKSIYTGNVKPEGLELAIDLPPETIDVNYAAFLKTNAATVTSFLITPDATTELALPDAELDDNAFRAIGNCKNLTWLDISGNKLSPNRLASLESSSRLTQLFASRCRFDLETLNQLNRITTLEELDLSSTNLTDQGLLGLAILPSLKNLSLGRTGITDAGIAHLSQFKNLESVDLTGTKVTAVGLSRLKTTLPNLTVRH